MQKLNLFGEKERVKEKRENKKERKKKEEKGISKTGEIKKRESLPGKQSHASQLSHCVYDGFC